ncbi:MAG TPA: cytochrome P450, partial [Mycobacterium sp.]|nr:cytochrome P450 [Mycobacterium sp.]
MTISTDPHGQSVTLDNTGDTSPYPFFDYMRRTEPVWHGSVMEKHVEIPPELVPEDEWVLFRYDDVFRAFRDDDKVFSSHNYDKTIGLVIGHTILAMSGKEHHNHRSLVAKAFRGAALRRWEPTIIRPVCEQLVDEFK